MADGDANEAMNSETPKRLARGRSLDHFGELKPAEASLLAHCAEGTLCVIGAEVPMEASRENEVRADLVRFLALGGDDQAPVNEQGVMIKGARLVGKLDLNGVKGATSIDLINCYIKEIDASYSEIKQLNLSGSQLQQGLVALEIRSGRITLDRVRSLQAVYLSGAYINGDLNCRGANIQRSEGSDQSDGYSLRCESASISGNVLLDEILISKQPETKERFHITGRADFSYANIGGILVCDGGSFINPLGDALRCSGLKLAGHAFLRHGFSAEGKVRFDGATIGGNFECTNGTFVGDDVERIALQCQGLKVGGMAYLTQGFKAQGMVGFVGASLDADLDCSGGNFINPGLSLWGLRMRIAGSLRLSDPLNNQHAIFVGQLDLTSAYVGELEDGEPTVWNRDKNNLVLDGFTYLRLGNGASTQARERIAWLKMQYRPNSKIEDFRPQPWDQLIAALRAAGHPNQARDVAVAREALRRRAQKIKPWPLRPLHSLYGLLAGYGFKPWRVCWLAIPVWLLGWALYATAADPMLMRKCGIISDKPLIVPATAKPADSLASQSLQTEALGFLAPIYSLDVLLPAISFGEKAKWQTVVIDQPASAHRFSWAVRGFYFFEIASGWITALMLTPWLASLVKKD